MRGSLKVYSRSNNNLVPIATLNTPGQLFGEQALLPGHQYRNAYVIALEDCLLAELSLQTFQALLKADPQSRARLEQKGRHELRDRLKKLGIGLENSVLEAADNSSKQLSAGQVLLPAGRVPSSAYSLVAGQLSMRPATADVLFDSGPRVPGGPQELIGQRPCRLKPWPIPPWKCCQSAMNACSNCPAVKSSPPAFKRWWSFQASVGCTAAGRSRTSQR